MIPLAAINQWSAKTPWPTTLQVEQDLLLSRLLIEIANHHHLGELLAFRGGTCLNKLHMDQPIRYSEDLDYVLTRQEPLGDCFDSLRKIADSIGFDVKWASGHPVTALYLVTTPTDTSGRIRIKLEINKNESQPFRPTIQIPFRVGSIWWEGEARVRTFIIEEILGTKVRALHQRRKGRDLLDLWYGITKLTSSDDVVMAAFHHYMAKNAFTFPQFEDTLDRKLRSAEFASDLEGLLVEVPYGYKMESAAEVVKARLGPYLRNFAERRSR
ncbi:MAG: nucleotidyl transferase AbiEii/AbiGii toxin family protein [Candidatus Dormibacteraceae bacterium]